VEASRAAHEEGSALGASAWEKVAGASVSVGAAGIVATPCVDGGHANDAEPQPEDVPSMVVLARRSPRGPGFIPP
jgi:hypothetical protein